MWDTELAVANHIYLFYLCPAFLPCRTKQPTQSSQVFWHPGTDDTQTCLSSARPTAARRDGIGHYPPETPEGRCCRSGGLRQRFPQLSVFPAKTPAKDYQLELTIFSRMDHLSGLCRTHSWHSMCRGVVLTHLSHTVSKRQTLGNYQCLKS